MGFRAGGGSREIGHRFQVARGRMLLGSGLREGRDGEWGNCGFQGLKAQRGEYRLQYFASRMQGRNRRVLSNGGIGDDIRRSGLEEHLVLEVAGSESAWMVL